MFFLNSTPFPRESSGATSAQAEILTEKSGEEIIESRSIQTPEDTTRANSGVWDEEVKSRWATGRKTGKLIATCTFVLVFGLCG